MAGASRDDRSIEVHTLADRLDICQLLCYLLTLIMILLTLYHYSNKLILKIAISFEAPHMSRKPFMSTLKSRMSLASFCRERTVIFVGESIGIPVKIA